MKMQNGFCVSFVGTCQACQLFQYRHKFADGGKHVITAWWGFWDAEGTLGWPCRTHLVLAQALRHALVPHPAVHLPWRRRPLHIDARSDVHVARLPLIRNLLRRAPPPRVQPRHIQQLREGGSSAIRPYCGENVGLLVCQDLAAGSTWLSRHCAAAFCHRQYTKAGFNHWTLQQQTTCHMGRRM